MSRRRVLAISPDLERLRRLVAVLERAGAEVDAVLDPHVLDGQIPHRFIFFAWDGILGELERLLPKTRQKAHITALVPKAPLPSLTQLLRDHRTNHVLVGDLANGSEAEHSLQVTAQKLLTGDIFGIEKYLPSGTPVNYFRMRDFQGRSTAIDTVLRYAEESGVRRQVRAAIGQVCEELLMNALYDAPVDESGNQIFAEVEPHARTGTMSPRPVSIRYAATEDQFAVAVRDRFGRLAKNTILAYIEKCLVSPVQIDRKAYGAGLGLYLVANAAAGYVVNVAFGMATEVVCIFDRGTRAPLRLVGVFVHPGQAAAHQPAASSSPPGGINAA